MSCDSRDAYQVPTPVVVTRTREWWYYVSDRCLVWAFASISGQAEKVTLGPTSNREAFFVSHHRQG